MFKRRTSKVRRRPQVTVLKANVMSPRIFWYDLLRSLGNLLRLLVMLAILGGIGWGIWMGVEKGLLHNDEFKLRSIQLNENPALDEIRLLEVSGIDLSASLFQCDVGEIESRLRALPELDSASVRREFPGTLIVEVGAREPVLWVASAERGIPARDRLKGLVVDEDGLAFRCPAGWHERAAELPVIELGASGGPLEPGMKVEEPEFLRGRRLYLLALEANADSARWIDSIGQHKPWASLLTTRDGIRATFGHDELERQMGDFLAAVEHAREKGDRIATIQLIGRRNMPVTFHETAPLRAIPVEEPEAPARPAGDEDLRQLLER